MNIWRSIAKIYYVKKSRDISSMLNAKYCYEKQKRITNVQISDTEKGFDILLSKP